MSAWYYRVMGEEVGPISARQLLDQLESGGVSPDTEVRPEEGAWRMAFDARPMLRAELAIKPPPRTAKPKDRPGPRKSAESFERRCVACDAPLAAGLEICFHCGAEQTAASAIRPAAAPASERPAARAAADDRDAPQTLSGYLADAASQLWLALFEHWPSLLLGSLCWLGGAAGLAALVTMPGEEPVAYNHGEAAVRLWCVLSFALPPGLALMFVLDMLATGIGLTATRPDLLRADDGLQVAAEIMGMKLAAVFIAWAMWMATGYLAVFMALMGAVFFLLPAAVYQHRFEMSFQQGMIVAAMTQLIGNLPFFLTAYGILVYWLLTA